MVKVRLALAALALLTIPPASALADFPDGGPGGPPVMCGDGMIGGAEICDSGMYNGQPFQCNATCTGWTAWCGDGQEAAGESCDDGGQNGVPGFCNATCTGTQPDQCGDWMQTGAEACDSGMYNGDPYQCNATCTGPTEWCGDGQTTGAEVCDEGGLNGQVGQCNATCTAIDPRTPFSDADRAPELQALTYGRVLGNGDYEASFALGTLPGVGLAPGYNVGLLVRTGSDAGRCGAACDVPVAAIEPDGSALVLDEGAGVPRRFTVDGAGWREVAPEAGTAFRPATIAVVGAELIVSEVGGSLSRAFDGDGREVRRATPWGAVTLAYDGGGRLTGATNAAGASLAIAYDGSGRVSSVTDPTGFTMTLLYAADGHLISLEGPPDGSVTPNIAFGWWGDDLTSVGRLGFNPVQLSYDNGLVTFVRDVEGSAYAFQATPTTLAVIDSSMQYRRLTYASGQLTSVETNAGTLTTFVRDGLGRVTQTRIATAGADLVTTVAYDAANRVIATTDPEGRTASATYDAAGNVATSTDPDGRTTTFTYDGAGRPLTVTDPLGRTTSTTYDANGLPLSATAGGITTSRTYGARGLVATETDAYGVTSSTTYDAAGRPTSVSRPGQPTVTIARTPTAGGEQVVVTRGSQTSTTTTDHYGRVTAESSSLGGSTTITYDEVTGLAASTSATYRGQTQTTATTYTNTGDAAAVWVNGQQRQSAARMVPPGNAWFQP